ncbi:hypothetical protein [Euzebya tangerina]|uniref:hypothetical protein n=1 Tax=Euzebya tangerina TaxID=591198 RepID=UPI000E323B4F|nr:hypothetical protein [Euzebya tangerina]
MPQLTMGTESVSEEVNRYTNQAGSVAGTRAEVQAIIEEVEGLLAQAQATEPRLNAALDTLGQDTASTLTATDGAEWTGASSDRFRGATGELVGSIDRTRAAMAEAYAEFRGAADNLNASLQEVGRQFDTTSAQAEEATREYGQVLLGHLGDTEALFGSGIS